MHIHMHVCMHICGMCTCEHTLKYLNGAHMHMHMHMHIYARMNSHMRAHVHVHVHVHVQNVVSVAGRAPVGGGRASARGAPLLRSSNI